MTEHNSGIDEPWTRYRDEHEHRPADKHSKRDWIVLAACPLLLFVVAGLNAVADGPRQINTTWPDFFGTIVVFVGYFLVPTFLAGVRYARRNDPQRG